jgi:hypothetical protein
MGMGRLVLRLLGLGLCLAGCSVEEGGAGADCVRSTECEMGFVCIEGACSDDLSRIGDPGEVPELMPDAGMDMAMPDAGEPPTPDAGDMTITPDAAAMAPADGG